MDSNLPFTEEELLEQEREDAGAGEVAPEDEEEPLPEIEMTIEEPSVEEDIFVKQPKLNKNGKPRKPMTQTQLDALKKARETASKKRTALKEARLLDKEIAKQTKAEVRRKKEDTLQNDEIVRSLVAEKTRHIQSATTWDEERLSSLMTKTIDTYMTTKRNEKEKRPPIPVSQPQFIPNPYYTKPPPAPAAKAPTPTRRPKNAMEELFGNLD